MPEDTLYDKDINVLIVKMRSHTVSQGVACNIKRNVETRVKKDFFKVIFHGAYCQAIALF